MDNDTIKIKRLASIAYKAWNNNINSLRFTNGNKGLLIFFCPVAD